MTRSVHRIVASTVGLMALLTGQVLAQDAYPIGPAAEELGIQLLRPNTKVKPGNTYVALVRQPAPLVPLGLDDLRPGDRITFRVLDDRRIVLSDGYGDRTAPVKLSESGAVAQAERLPNLKLDKRGQRQARQPQEQPQQNPQQRAPQTGVQSGIGGFGGGRQR